MKKSKLLFETTFDFDLLGLVAPLKDYKLAWLINTTFSAMFFLLLSGIIQDYKTLIL